MPKEKTTFGWIFAFAGQKKKQYMASVALAVAGAAFQMLPFFVMARVINRLLAGDRDLSGYLADCAVMAAFWLLRVLLHALSTAQSHQAIFAVLANIRKQGLEKLARMPLGDVQAKGSGELKSILVERVDSMEPTLAHVLPEMSSNAAAALATLVYLLCLDWRMALAALITLPLGMVFFALMMAGYEKNYACTVAATNALNDAAVEYIGGALVRAGTLAPEKFVLIVRLSMGLITPPIGCMKFTDDLAKVGTVIGEVTAILTAPELSRPETDTETPQGSTVALRNVHFGYGEKEVLHGVSLTFREGTVNAMVGPSGSGKSTIAKLIAAFWDVNSGSITLGGADIRNISAEHYHRLVAYVSQDNFLFDTTVRENIRMGRPGATDAEVEQAARDCGCYDFIMGLERGFDTPVGSGGGHLSGGERQRLSIARAMMKDAPIIILDEATASFFYTQLCA